MKKFFNLIILLTITLIHHFPTFAQPIIDLKEYATGLTLPVDIASAGDDRLFVVSKSGFIQIVNADSQVLDVPFLDIRDRVVGPNPPDERGLLGLAFHPDYENNGYFYVNYTGNNSTSFISRFSVSSDNPNVADPNSELVLITIGQPFGNHNAGDLAFGQDGYLYIPMGDGGAGGDPGDRAQNESNLLGKILRIDIDNPDEGLNYGIPNDNPFLDEPDIPNEIWALGLRNPWRFSFDRLTYDIWIGDVGQNSWEEVSFLPAGQQSGANYGWRCLEGSNNFNLNGIGCDDVSSYIRPVFEYRNNPGQDGCSITGGFVYRGTKFPLLYGQYVVTDYCSGKFWTIAPDDNEEWTVIDHGAKQRLEYSTFGEDKDGELFVAAMIEGTIYRVSEVCSPLIPRVTSDENVLSTSSDADNFQWFRNGESIEGAVSETFTPTLSGEYTVEASFENGCQVTSEPFPFNIVSVRDMFEDADVLFMPNPFSDEAMLTFPNPDAYPFEVTISDLQGRTLQHKTNIRTGTVNISRENLPSGIYLLELKGKKLYFGKIEVTE